MAVNHWTIFGALCYSIVNVEHILQINIDGSKTEPDDGPRSHHLCRQLTDHRSLMTDHWSLVTMPACPDEVLERSLNPVSW